jgi:hypothetical protein
MTDQIFILRDDGTLVPVPVSAYDSEDTLQKFLAGCPDLLAGAQIDPPNPRRWLLVRREAGVPDATGMSDRWALDHLFLDQDGIPTMIEVKRASNTEIRRTVAGQMLDYAANGVVYWPIDRLQGWFAQTHGGPDRADIVLRNFLGEHGETEVFWEAVRENLRTGNVRMIFVADSIPTELQRIVEFLNEQMSPAEVLAVEIKNHEAGSLRALVPRSVGRTAAAQAQKPTADTRTFDELRAAATPRFRECLEWLQDWAHARGLTTGTAAKSWKVIAPGGGTLLWAYPLREKVEFSVSLIRERGDPDAAAEVLNACQDIVGGPLAEHFPTLDSSSMVANWERIESDVLNRLAVAASANPVGPTR